MDELFLLAIKVIFVIEILKNRYIMRTLISIFGAVCLVFSGMAQQVIEWQGLLTVTDKTKAVVYRIKSDQQPLEGSYQIKRGRDVEEATFYQGRMKGEYRRYRNGVLREKGHYTDGLRHGTFVEYYQDGVTPRKVTPLEHGKINGTMRTYFRNGQKEMEKVYRLSVAKGWERHYHAHTGKLIREIQFVAGRKEGKSFEITEEGQRIVCHITRHYQNDKLHGAFHMEATQDGKPYLILDGQYREGKKYGIWKQYDAVEDRKYEWEEK